MLHVVLSILYGIPDVMYDCQRAATTVWVISCDCVCVCRYVISQCQFMMLGSQTHNLAMHAHTCTCMCIIPIPQCHLSIKCSTCITAAHMNSYLGHTGGLPSECWNQGWHISHYLSYRSQMVSDNDFQAFVSDMISSLHVQSPWRNLYFPASVKFCK